MKGHIKIPLPHNKSRTPIINKIHKPIPHAVSFLNYSEQKLHKAKKYDPNRKVSPFYIPGKIKSVNLFDPKLLTGYLTFSNFYFDYFRDKLGSGAVADVYLARHLQDQKKFAVKKISKQKLVQLGIDETPIIQEIQNQINVDHPNIIKLYTFSNTPTDICIVMEYLSGGTLFKKIKKSHGFSEKAAFKYFIQLASAIHFLHQNNMCHRDIKSENVLCDDKGKVKLCDFGMCVKMDTLRRTFCGTPEYMAPELVTKQYYSKEVDIWALGVLLFEMTHGYSPFADSWRTYGDPNQDVNNVFYRVMMNQFKVDMTKNLSPECVDMIYRLLDFNPNSRITSTEIFNHPWVRKFEELEYQMPTKKITVNASESTPIVKNLNANFDSLGNFPLLDFHDENLNLMNNSFTNFGVDFQPKIYNLPMEQNISFSPVNTFDNIISAPTLDLLSPPSLNFTQGNYSTTNIFTSPMSTSNNLLDIIF